MRIPVLLTTLILVCLALCSNSVLYAHTFSENENGLFLTMIDKIKGETGLVGQLILNETLQAQTHAKLAQEILVENDPFVNTTWTKQIAETNPRVASELVKSLIDLKNAIDSRASFMKVTELVHANLLPKLITAYNLTSGHQ